MTDEELLSKLAESEAGLTARELAASFKGQYPEADVIKAIQRGFDRGSIKLGRGARLIETKGTDDEG